MRGCPSPLLFQAFTQDRHYRPPQSICNTRPLTALAGTSHRAQRRGLGVASWMHTPARPCSIQPKPQPPPHVIHQNMFHTHTRNHHLPPSRIGDADRRAHMFAFIGNTCRSLRPRAFERIKAEAVAKARANSNLPKLAQATTAHNHQPLSLLSHAPRTTMTSQWRQQP